MTTTAADAQCTRAPRPATPAPQRGDTLLARSARSGMWVALEHVGLQGMRFGRNLVLTHLLFREAFGLVIFVTVVIQGLQMFSDIGIGPSIIQDRRGEDPDYLNTAWTIQAIRGVALWLVAGLLAFPAAILWEKPDLVMLLPIAAISALAAGLNSTNLFSLNRRLRLGPVVRMKLSIEVLSTIVMIVWAYLSPSVWALVAGIIVSSVGTMVASHLYIPGIENRFRWDPTAVRDLYRFGRWIFFSTAATFLAGRLSDLLMPMLLGFAFFGVFGIAMLLVRVPEQLTHSLANRIGFPALSDIYRRDQDRFHVRLRQMRIAFAIPTSLIMLAIIVAGPYVVDLIYPEDFHDAGWMLRLLAFNAIGAAVCKTYGDAFLAMGDSFGVMLSVSIQAVLVVILMLSGFWLAGGVGTVTALGFVAWSLYPFQAFLAIRRGVWQPGVDFPMLAAFGALGALAVWGF